MLRKITSFLKEPCEYAQELEAERLNINIKREKVLSVILIIITAVLLLVSGTDITTLIFMRVVLLLVPLIFLFCIFIKDKLIIKSTEIFIVCHRALNLCVLVMCPVMAVFTEEWQQPFSYVVSLFTIAAMVLFTQWERVFLYLVSYLVYVVGIFTIHPDEEGLLSSIVFMFILVMVAFLISRTSYMAFAANYIHNRIILDKNQEMDKLYHITEETLEKRTIELQKVVEYEKLRTNFFANISHELRTPLTLIYSAHQMIDLHLKNTNSKGFVKDPQKYIHIIRQNCYRLIRLISNLIDMTKLDAGYIEPNFCNCDIVKVVREISLSVDQFIESKGIHLIFETELQGTVIAIDTEMLERIMLNLLSNAVKFTPKGGSISVKIFACEQLVKISVKDTGIGIPEHMQSLVFERFVQTDSSKTRNREGSGIGLSLVKSLVDLHNGTIELKSREGEGTEIVIGFPMNKLPDGTFNSNVESDRRIEKINIEFSDIYS